LPADQRPRPNHDHGIAPIEEPGKQRQRHSRRGITVPRLGEALLVQRELPAEKELLRFNGWLSSEQEDKEADQVGK